MRTSFLVAAAVLSLAFLGTGSRAVDNTPRLVAAPSAAALTSLAPAGEGRRLYLALNCYGCHGMFAAGGMGPNIIGKERHDVSEAVLQGKDEGMPSYRDQVDQTDITNLTAYLRSIGTANEPVFMDWWKKVPPK
jgi:mono/diheme cytochrome c family protein